MSIVPELHEFRNVVNSIPNKRDSTLIKMLYLTAARVSEVVGKATPSDIQNNLTRAYGTNLNWKLVSFDSPLMKECKLKKILLITMPVAKRSSKKLVLKYVALPCDPRFEPWTLDLMRRIQKRKGDLTFPMTRYRVYQIVREWLWKKSRLEIFKPKPKPIKDEGENRIMNPWRHIRLTHLVQYYGFDSYDLCVYSGWAFQTIFKGSAGQLDTYLHLDYRRYLPKLLKPLAMLL